MLAITIASYFTVAITVLITIPAILPTVVVSGNAVLMVVLFTAALLLCGIACDGVDSRHDGIIPSYIVRFFFVITVIAVFNTVYARFGVGFTMTDIFSTVLLLFGIPAALVAIDELLLPAVDAMFYEPRRVARRQYLQRIAAIRSERPMYVRRSIH